MDIIITIVLDIHLSISPDVVFEVEWIISPSASDNLRSVTAVETPH